MKHLLSHLIQRHLIPLLLLPVVLSGLACFAIFGLVHELRTSSTSDLRLSWGLFHCLASSARFARPFFFASFDRSLRRGRYLNWDVQRGQFSLSPPGLLAWRVECL